MAIIHKVIKRYLKYEFSAAENEANAKELARKYQERGEFTNKKKRIAAELKMDEEMLEGRISKLSFMVSEGSEFRDLECRVELHEPRTGHKSIIREDTGVLVEIVPMERHEMQAELPLEDPPQETTAEPSPADGTTPESTIEPIADNPAPTEESMLASASTMGGPHQSKKKK